VDTLSADQVARSLLGITLLLTAAHSVGYLFSHLRQPRVIGEIVGGFLLGPTVFGAIAPRLQAEIFPATGAVPVVLDGVYQLGLLLLMFVAGAEMRSAFRHDERRTVGVVTVTGMVVPAAIGLIFASMLPVDLGVGTAHDRTAFAIVFMLAIAVTSIPVIARIMSDLGVLETAFARIVLAVGVIEDVIVYVLLAVALGLVSAGSGDQLGVPAMLGIEGGTVVNVIYHVAATLGFLAVGLWAGPAIYRWVLRFRYNLVRKGSAIGFQLVFMLGFTVAGILLGVVPLFGAFVAGIVVASSSAERAAEARETIRTFSFAFFIPLYFAIVGLRLDLLHSFNPVFFLSFLVVACATKFVSVWAGARIAGESPSSATNLGVALNARGGPGIVLASVALGAGIIDESFYATLVLLAIVTSLLAGSWLGHVVRSGTPLRQDAKVPEGSGQRGRSSR
jgi:Kef-type K+ transport system membrane component KefB